MELDTMATELWLWLSCEWTEAVEEGGDSYDIAMLLKCSYYYSQSLFLSILCSFFLSLSSPQLIFFSKHVFVKLSTVQNLTHQQRELRLFSQLQGDSIPDGLLFVDILFLSLWSLSLYSHSLHFLASIIDQKSINSFPHYFYCLTPTHTLPPLYLQFTLFPLSLCFPVSHVS